MSISLIVVALGALIAAAGTGVMTARCARDPRMYIVAWAIALFGLAVALGAQTLGDLAGYSAVMFRAMELGAQVVAPLAICLGLAELVGRSLPARFAMRLACSAIAIIAIVILGTDPLSAVAAFSKHWPNPAVYYEVVPKAVLAFLLAPFVTLTAVSAALVSLLRSRREGAASTAALPVLAAAAAGLLLAWPGLALLLAHAGISLPAGNRAFAPACLLASALTWAAAAGADQAGIGRLARDGADAHTPDWEDDGDHAVAGRWADGQADPDGGYETGEFDGYSRGAAEPDDQFAAEAAGPAGYDRAAGYDGNGREPAEAVRPPAGPDISGSYPGLAALIAEPPGQGSDQSAATDPLAGAVGDESGAQTHLFGQIAIYTLIEDRIEEFDRLTERVVAQVRAREPDTLVYIVHAVPTAPMQRILYEVYRDRAAYTEHARRPYIIRYEEERRPLVLAANVIELGLRQAKVSPLPSISDLLSESGIDLTGVTRSPRAGAPPQGTDAAMGGTAQAQATHPAPVPPAPARAPGPGHAPGPGLVPPGQAMSPHGPMPAPQGPAHPPLSAAPATTPHARPAPGPAMPGSAPPAGPPGSAPHAYPGQAPPPPDQAQPGQPDYDQRYPGWDDRRGGDQRYR